MKIIIIFALSLVFISTTQAATSMKVEGSCSGTLKDGTEVSYTYYSNYNGCKKISTAALNFTSGIEGLFTGKRSFTRKSDLYTFNGYQLRFANSTGNTSGKLTYRDFTSNEKTTVTLQCEVRDYEYADC